MMRLAALLAFLVFVAPSCARAEADPDFVRMWEEAQKGRPASLDSTARIAPEGEPGEPMRIRGTAYLEDGVTPAAGVVVFAYQTDATGRYGERGAATWRLHGWARADAEGRFELLTIRPGAYPNRSTPAHVHFTMEGAGMGRRWAGDLEFEDDPRLTDREKSRSAAEGRFGSIRPVRRAGDATQLVEVHLRPRGDF